MNKKLLSTAVLLLSTIICSWSQIACPELVEWEIPAKLKDRPEQIIKHAGYTISYNIAHGTPNWSAWVLTKSHTSTSSAQVQRSDVFLADPVVPIRYRVLPTDYQGSGFDRGHMCPAADMAWNQTVMKESFYMSNMCPQTPTLNRVYWKQLESKCREWVLSEDTLYIVCGPIYTGVPKTIGRTHKVEVPVGFYKVVLSLRKGHAKAIGFYYVNSAAKQSMSATATTVDAIERLTGIDFFYSLPDDLENKLESHCNL